MSDLTKFGVHLAPKTKHYKCQLHGDFESRCFVGSIWTKCPSCVAFDEEQDRAKAEADEREATAAAWRRKIGKAGIPERFQDCSLKTFVADTDPKRRALAFAENYADGFIEALARGRSALFIGKPGTGKTHLAVGIGLRIMHREGRTVLFSTVMRALRRVKDTWSKGSTETETQAVAALVFPELLILDEVGIQFGSETEKMILFDILNDRYETRRPTILLSNLVLDEIKCYLGERVFDRLREDNGQVIIFDWESHRGKVKTQAPNVKVTGAPPSGANNGD